MKEKFVKVAGTVCDWIHKHPVITAIGASALSSVVTGIIVHRIKPKTETEAETLSDPHMELFFGGRGIDIKEYENGKLDFEWNGYDVRPDGNVECCFDHCGAAKLAEQGLKLDKLEITGFDDDENVTVSYFTSSI